MILKAIGQLSRLYLQGIYRCCMPQRNFFLWLFSLNLFVLRSHCSNAETLFTNFLCLLLHALNLLIGTLTKEENLDLFYQHFLLVVQAKTFPTYTKITRRPTKPRKNLGRKESEELEQRTKKRKKKEKPMLLYVFSCSVFHHDFQTLETIKALSQRPSAFIRFLMRGTHDETIVLVFEISLFITGTKLI